MPDEQPQLVRFAPRPPTLAQRIGRALYLASVVVCVLVLVAMFVACWAAFGAAIMAGF